VLAGVGGMPYRLFVVYNVAGGIGWVMSTTFAGYFLGKLVPNIDDHIHTVIAVVIFLSLLPAIVKVVRERWKVRKRADTA
jgi:membrane-associated protein